MLYPVAIYMKLIIMYGGISTKRQTISKLKYVFIFINLNITVLYIVFRFMLL